MDHMGKIDSETIHPIRAGKSPLPNMKSVISPLLGSNFPPIKQITYPSDLQNIEDKVAFVLSKHDRSYYEGIPGLIRLAIQVDSIDLQKVARISIKLGFGHDLGHKRIPLSIEKTILVYNELKENAMNYVQQDGLAKLGKLYNISDLEKLKNAVLAMGFSDYFVHGAKNYQLRLQDLYSRGVLAAYKGNKHQIELADYIGCTSLDFLNLNISKLKLQYYLGYMKVQITVKQMKQVLSLIQTEKAKTIADLFKMFDGPNTTLFQEQLIRFLSVLIFDENVPCNKYFRQDLAEKRGGEVGRKYLNPNREGIDTIIKEHGYRAFYGNRNQAKLARLVGTNRLKELYLRLREKGHLAKLGYTCFRISTKEYEKIVDALNDKNKKTINEIVESALGTGSITSSTTGNVLLYALYVIETLLSEKEGIHTQASRFFDICKVFKISKIKLLRTLEYKKHMQAKITTLLGSLLNQNSFVGNRMIFANYLIENIDQGNTIMFEEIIHDSHKYKDKVIECINSYQDYELNALERAILRTRFSSGAKFFDNQMKVYETKRQGEIHDFVISKHADESDPEKELFHKEKMTLEAKITSFLENKLPRGIFNLYLQSGDASLIMNYLQEHPEKVHDLKLLYDELQDFETD